MRSATRPAFLSAFARRFRILFASLVEEKGPAGISTKSKSLLKYDGNSKIRKGNNNNNNRGRTWQEDRDESQMSQTLSPVVELRQDSVQISTEQKIHERTNGAVRDDGGDERRNALERALANLVLLCSGADVSTEVQNLLVQTAKENETGIRPKLFKISF